RTAQRTGITLADSERSTALRQAAAALTPALAGLHRQPRDVVLISADFRTGSVPPGEPAFLSLLMTNVTDRPVPVGPDGVVKTTIGLADTTRNAKRPLFGIYAVEETQ